MPIALATLIGGREDQSGPSVAGDAFSFLEMSRSIYAWASALVGGALVSIDGSDATIVRNDNSRS